MKRLMEEKGLTREQAAGVVGNLGHESAGFTAFEEGAPNKYGTRGAGWAQWTDTPGSPRRTQFENWSRQHGLDPKSPEASERYLFEGDPEFAKAIDAVKGTQTTAESVRAFHDSFERSAHPDAPGRYSFANRAASGNFGSAEGMNWAGTNQQGFTNPVIGGNVISEHGAARPGGTTGRHQGIDIGAPAGTGIRATTDQTITQVGVIGGKYGYGVKAVDAEGREHVYAHMQGDPRELGLAPGQQVKAGQSIGAVGNTGNARNTPSHLHYEVRPRVGAYAQSYNPRQFLGAPKGGAVARDPDRSAREEPSAGLDDARKVRSELEEPIRLNFAKEPGADQFARSSIRRQADRELRDARATSFADIGAA